MDQVKILPFENKSSLNNTKEYVKLDVNNEFISQLFGELPSLGVALSTSNLYSVTFPKGVQGELVRLKQGGFGSMLKNPENEQFVGSASFDKAGYTALAITSAFSAMSIASGQYFLSKINDKLSIITQSIDKILEFLYGDKRAELLSEISFVRDVFQNYSSIMQHSEQRIATVIGLQQSRKVAIKDIEFYISDLDSVVSLEHKLTINEVLQKAFMIRESLLLSVQLFSTANMLEAFIAMNSDEEYLKNISTSLNTYVHKCNSRILSSFSMLKQRIANHEKDRNPLKEKIDTHNNISQIDQVVNALSNKTDSEEQRYFSNMIKTMSQSMQFVFDRDGNTFYKITP